MKAVSVLAGSLDLEGVAAMGRKLPGFRLFHLPSLHAKVYVADQQRAIVTSGNLTDGGLRTNCEYGVLLCNPTRVKEIREDFERYAGLGAQMSVDDAAQIAADLFPLRAAYQSALSGITSRSGGAVAERLHRAQERMLAIRGRGRSTHAIFCDSIEYLLKSGPLATVEIHPLIQGLHPDICGDRIDRLIGGVNFGKRWKHYVRTAQQALKRARRIVFDGRRWRLAAGASERVP